MRNKSSNVLWGICLIVLAAYILFGSYITIPPFPLFKIIVSVFCLSITIDGIKNRSFFQSLVPLAIIGILFDNELGITAITPWSLLASTILLSWGLDLIFRPRRPQIYNNNYNYQERSQYNYSYNDSYNESGSQYNDGKLRIENNFGSHTRYIDCAISTVETKNNFGQLSVYLDNATLISSSAFMDVKNNFGTTKIYIPYNYKVVANPRSSFGTVQVFHNNPQNENAPEIVINCNAAFGSIMIY